MPSAFRNAWRILKQGNPWEGKNVPKGWPYGPAEPAGTPDPNLHPMRQPPQDDRGPWEPYPNPDSPPFREPMENPYRPFQPDIAMQITMIEAQIQELLQKKAELEAQLGGGGGGEGAAPPPNPYGDPPPGSPPFPNPYKPAHPYEERYRPDEDTAPMF